MAKRSPVEAIAWLMFSAGGMVSALVAPVLLLVFGLMVPLGLVAPDHAHLASVLGHPLTRLALLVVCVLSLLHWAHRFRYTLFDGLQLQRSRTPINVACYGVALAGSVWAVIVLFG
jgi:fumarate reductase subunit D